MAVFDIIHLISDPTLSVHKWQKAALQS